MSAASDEPSASEEASPTDTETETETGTEESATPSESDEVDSGQPGREIDVFALAVGDCFQDPPESDVVSTVELIDCDTPHDNEVYHVEDLPDGPFPGRDELDAAVDEVCQSAFLDFVGTDYRDSELFVFPLSPTKESWATGDREVLCALYLPDEELTGSMRGSER